MLSRRELLTGSVAGGLGGTPASLAAASRAELEQQADREGQREIARSVAQVESALRSAFLTNSLAHGTVAKIREQMEQFFRSNAKFPDFIDVGIGVFVELYDWHVKNRQQVVVTRAPDGRYWMQFMFTNMVLRPEVDRAFIGIAYDKV